MSRFLFASDLHGNREAYEALFAMEGDALVLGGDLLPHPPGRGAELLNVQRRFAVDFLAPRLRSRPVFWLLGNDDWAAILPALERAGTFMHRRAVPFLDGLSIAGYSCVPVTPFGLKDFDRFDTEAWSPTFPPSRCLVSDSGGVMETTLDAIRARGTIARDLEQLAAASDPGRTVYVMHSPPWDSGLDRLHSGEPVGSRAIRAFIEKHGPPITLHGHIHESPGVVRLGASVCANPGDSAQRLRALVVDLSDRSVTPLPRT